MTRSLSVLFSVLGLAACTVTPAVPNPTPDSDAGPRNDAGADAAQPTLAFQPSNIVLTGLDLSTVGDADLSSDCELATAAMITAGDGTGSACFRDFVETVLTQSDGSKIHVLIFKSLKIEPNVHVTVDLDAGGLPLALVALGDMAILGTLDVGARGDTAYGGGFQSTQNTQKGAGPGGGPAATAAGTPGAGAGGGSYCGLGGQGGLESGATPPASAPTAAYGTPELIPLVGGSSGGSGSFGAGAGGGAVQLVAFGQFSTAAGSFISVGGGGGQPAVSSSATDNAGGGGSGGSILIEATGAQIAGILAANGGGGGGTSAKGQNATPNATPAAGGAMAGQSAGGAGSAGAGIAGAAAASGAGPVGGGGGGAGRIRINTITGVAVITSATLSPAATTTCVTQGKVKANAK